MTIFYRGYFSNKYNTTIFYQSIKFIWWSSYINIICVSLHSTDGTVYLVTCYLMVSMPVSSNPAEFPPFLTIMIGPIFLVQGISTKCAVGKPKSCAVCIQKLHICWASKYPKSLISHKASLLTKFNQCAFSKYLFWFPKRTNVLDHPVVDVYT